MRVTTVGIYRHDRQVFRDQIVATEGLGNPLLHVVFGGAAVAHALANFLEGSLDDGIDSIARGKVALDLLVCPSGFKAGDKITGADNFFAEAADQLDRACVYQADIRHEVVGRILHGDGLVRLQHGFEVVPKLTPGRIFAFAAGQSVKMASLNAMDQFDRRTLPGDYV